MRILTKFDKKIILILIIFFLAIALIIKLMDHHHAKTEIELEDVSPAIHRVV